MILKPTNFAQEKGGIIMQPYEPYYDIERRKDIREKAKKLRRQYLIYRDAEIIYSMSHKKLLDLATRAGATDDG